MLKIVNNSLIGVLTVALAACGGQSSADPRTEAPLVRTATVKGADTGSRSFTGTVAARVQSDLGFRVSGKVSQRLVDAGQTVRRGQVLMRIDPSDLRLAAQAQQQAVLAAQAQATRAIADEARYRTLVGTGAVSASSYDQSKAVADAARAQLAAARAQAQVANNANQYAELLADADGVVMETLAEPGQVVNAGQPVVRLARTGDREAIVHLPETLRPALGSTGRAMLYGDSRGPVPAKLRQLSDAADPLTRTYEARYVLDGVLADAPLGATVTVDIESGATSTEGLQVPIGALFDPGKGTGVWVLEGKPTKTVWRPVQVLEITAEMARVKGNLRTGTQVVAIGAHLVKNGQVVVPMSERTAHAGAQP
ncbi:efflux RND transporter periplasmic adaptor subunit [Pseudoxanthomonas sp. Root630]|uniref:efflux RND transporter periplasmic adaptor subunit n=1 Tax=Pseudoxanthomonas sp. Root630 TaxID=1736574 RepID=UPI0007023F35|nr:efflux RND transporter periplasmic adaptor subunit [Pseudoxanthomonas sp. Root630]KRA50870.1 hemolysin secretion protein D [Pseudoxanthomonas sp. Root630]